MTNLEHQLSVGTAHPQTVAAVDVDAAQRDGARLRENLVLIHAELDAPREPWLARTLRRLGVPDLSVPLVTATPALRRSWFVAVMIAVLFALTVASNDNGEGVDRIAVFLTLAPLVPLLGVALAFGKGVDPTHDQVVAAPRDTFQVFLIRALTVLVASASILLLTSLLLPAGGFFRLAWLVPSFAMTGTALALSSRFAAQRVAIGLSVSWLALVVIVSSASSVAAMFGPVTQLVTAVITAAAAGFVVTQRERFEAVEVSS